MGFCLHCVILFLPMTEILSRPGSGNSRFFYKKRMLCYLYSHKKCKQPYLAITDGNQIDHPALLVENRKRVKIILIDPEEDLPVATIREILRQAIDSQ